MEKNQFLQPVPRIFLFHHRGAVRGREHIGILSSCVYDEHQQSEGTLAFTFPFKSLLSYSTPPLNWHK